MDRRSFLKNMGLTTGSVLLSANLFQCSSLFKPRKRPNILWILGEDMSCHWSCYGETTITTPNMDKCASEGVLFKQAFVTCPVCSPIRSSLVSGMFQTKLGAHNHRSQRIDGKGGGEQEYHNSFVAPVKLLPELFQQAGYFTVLGSMNSFEPAPVKQDTLNQNNAEEKPVPVKLGKSDYNFVWDNSMYDSNDWRDRAPDQPFFAQIQLHGGKAREATVPNPVNPDDCHLPPYYPDFPVMREDWAHYLNSVLAMDAEVGKILQRLDEDGLAENTVVILFTDHGISHLRGKQFLYDEGIQVPLIIRWPGEMKPNTIREDLVSTVDLPATSLALAGIKTPSYYDGKNILAKKVKPATFVAAARDRCDETMECIRCIRTDQYKYIRNYFANHPHLQFNQYKDGKEITKTMRNLYAEGKLNQLQARIFQAPRPVEELYDIKADPLELDNLAMSSEFQETLEKIRKMHRDWMKETKDLGLIPEPILEDMGKEYGNKYFILQDSKNKDLVDNIIDVIELEEKGKSAITELVEKCSDESPCIRFRAAYGLGNMGDSAKMASDILASHLSDESASVRIAAARALCLIGENEKGCPVLLRELKTSSNHIVRLYAALFFEDIGDAARKYLPDFKIATQDNNDFVRRVTRRLVRTFEQNV